VHFQGRVLDYVLDKSSGKLLLGSMAYPAVFQEYWDLERPLGQSPWVVQDIRER
jgi:predicted lipid-binding transport protein (Tim44 family)